MEKKDKCVFYKCVKLKSFFKKKQLKRNADNSILEKNKIMKLKVIFTFLFFTLFSFQNLFSQSFVDEGNQWSLVSYNFAGDAHNTTYRIEGDTTINGMEYKKLWYTFENPILANWVLSKFIREDSTKQVFEKVGMNSEEIIYNFGLSAGDTIFNNVLPGLNGLISEVDSIELNDGSMRKRLALSSLDCPDWGIIEYWVEGIGGVNLAFKYIDYFCVYDVGLHLQCFSNHGNFLYGSPNGSQCFIINSINDIEEIAIKIFPNPTQDILNLEYDEITKIEALNIFDFQGQLIRSLQVENPISQISISNFPKGVYYLKIETIKGTFILNKFIKL